MNADGFWSRVDRRGPDECWPWKGTVTPTGYGSVRWGVHGTSAHRVAYMLGNGAEIPAGLQADHRCHTEDVTCAEGAKCLHRRCCNPAHIRLLTPKQNRATRRLAPLPEGSDPTDRVCVRGHPFAGNRGAGGRCRLCDSEVHRRARAIRREARVEAQRGKPPMCRWGHVLDGDNVVILKDRARCRACQVRYQHEYRARRAATLKGIAWATLGTTSTSPPSAARRTRTPSPSVTATTDA